MQGGLYWCNKGTLEATTRTTICSRVITSTFEVEAIPLHGRGDGVRGGASHTRVLI